MFVNGLLTGVLVGLGLMFLWRKLMRAKRLHRYHQAMDHASLFTVRKPEDIEKMIGHFPKWINFSEFEQVEWLNAQLKELWPYVNKAVQGTIVETVEPMLKGYSGGTIASMEFTRTDLGTQSPEVRGVKVSSLQHNQVVLDMEMNWQGNCKFKLAIVTAARATVTPCIENLSFTGTLRVILELTDKLPVVAAYVAAINRKSGGDDFDIDFKVTGAGLGAIPGLGGMIDDIIQSSVSNMMLWPNRITGALIEGYDISHLEFRYSGAVVVTVVRANNLKKMDTIGDSDPRVVLFCRDTHKFATAVIDNNLNPVWQDEVFEIPVDDVHTAELKFLVQDEDSLGVVVNWEDMGWATLPLEEVYQERDDSKEWTLTLVNSLKNSERTSERFGTLTIKAVYRSFDTDEERKKVTEDEQKWKPNEKDKRLPPEKAREARQRAIENARNRGQNKDVVKGVGAAVQKLLVLQKGKLQVPTGDSASGQKPEPSPVAAVASSVSSASSRSVSVPAPARPAQPPTIRKIPSAPSPVDAQPDAPAAALSAATPSAPAPAPAAPISGTPTAPISVTPTAPITGTPTAPAPAAPIIPPAALTAPPEVPPAISVPIVPALPSLAATGGPSSRPQSVSLPRPDGLLAAAASETAPLVTYDSSPPLAPPSPAHSQAGALTDDEKQGARQKVSSFFKGVGHSITEKFKGGTHMSLDAEAFAEHTRPVTPGTATPRRSIILGAFKSKEKKAAEI